MPNVFSQNKEGFGEGGNWDRSGCCISPSLPPCTSQPPRQLANNEVGKVTFPEILMSLTGVPGDQHLSSHGLH